MTDITKRLAEALRKVNVNTPTLANYQEAKAALADFDRTAAQEANVANMCGSAGGQFIVAAPHPAAQEANVQGGEWVMVPREPTQEMMDATQEAFTAINGILARAGMGFSLSDNGYPPIRNAYVAMLAAAPHPTPAPASGAVTDAARRILGIISGASPGYSYAGAGRSLPIPSNQCLRVYQLRLVCDAVLEAATRARQGEVGIPAGWPKGGLGAPNAADAEAYRAPRLGDAEKLSEVIGLHDLVDHTGGNIISDWLVLEGLERIGAVIPTAAPVPAEQDRVGRLQIYVEKELCSLLGRPWATSGFSLETLIADLRKRLAVPADEGEM